MPKLSKAEINAAKEQESLWKREAATKKHQEAASVKATKNQFKEEDKLEKRMRQVEEQKMRAKDAKDATADMFQQLKHITPAATVTDEVDYTKLSQNDSYAPACNPTVIE